ncbi:HlyC/CorC family transporter [Ketobacter alkanivorans]|uniref:Magnesium and cobalt efflux protein CorC n=1 Tax=Ketobacter alkanivorans TaxID=1917421 RepID=A0A2K9LIB6_9GAMM|nr:transporter associated domain-containing protein [Ketobacter alkanivorans]AUM12106.1 magnesium/cobalt efflux protein [Ketobacter alkanivorans]MCP5019190.1 CBS domain-containing protein [Ketobacter sp.]
MNDDHSRNGSSGKSFIDKIANFLSGEPQNQSEVLEILTNAHHSGLVEAEALGIFQGALQVSDMQVREIMVPRPQCIIINATAKPEEYLPPIIESAHSRFPVYGESTDDIIGILLAKDLLDLAYKGKLEKTQLKDLIRPASLVPESKRLNVLLREFRQTRTHMAIVVNEYGKMSGLVTIEDVLEQIVGEIDDEHDFDDDYMIKQAEGNEFMVKAVTPIDEFNEHFATKFNEDEYDTIGGIVLSHFGHLPKREENVIIGKYNFTVMNADNRAIRLLKVSPIQH